MRDEKILVVKRDTLFANQTIGNGLIRHGLDSFVDCIQDHKEFLPRALMETDPSYKQIIPYLVFTHDNKFFLMQRTGTASEARLRNNYSLGIGGHIRQEDCSTNSIFAWAEREFHEEINYQGAVTIEPLGILNDDSNEVGTVHLGLVLLLRGTNPEISIKSELKSGVLVPLEHLATYEPEMENWSKILLPYLSPATHSL